MTPTGIFDIESSSFEISDSSSSVVCDALMKAGIKSDGNMLDIMVNDLDILAEAIQLKNQRYACLAIERLMSFRGFRGASLDQWHIFSKEIHKAVTAEEQDQ